MANNDRPMSIGNENQPRKASKQSRSIISLLSKSQRLLPGRLHPTHPTNDHSLPSSGMWPITTDANVIILVTSVGTALGRSLVRPSQPPLVETHNQTSLDIESGSNPDSVSKN